MNKDPRDVLQSFEVDENECILEYRPKKKKGKKAGAAQLSNTAILSLCLMTGLSAGVGSAYIGNVKAETKEVSKAEMKVEVPAEIPVVDEPIVQPEAEADLPTPPEPKRNEEVIPSPPPLDQPVTSGGSFKMKTSQVKEEKDEEGEKAKEQKPQKKNQVTSYYSPGKSSENPKSVKQQGNISTTRQKGNMQTTHTTPSKQQKTDQSASPTDQSQQAQLTASSNSKPKTEQGGKLPDTAGNDLNNALLGGAVAALGALYYGKRRKAEQE